VHGYFLLEDIPLNRKTNSKNEEKTIDKLTNPSIVFHECNAIAMQITIEKKSPELHSIHEKSIVDIVLKINA